MKNTVITAILSLATGAIVLTALSGQALAAESKCQVVYGGGQICETVTRFTLDKKIQSFSKGGTFVDNIAQADGTFAPGQQVAFRITVQNTGDNTIEDLDVADILPEELEFVSGPGNYDADSRTISYTIDRLEAGATDEQTFIARIKEAGALPQENVICTTNSARAIAANNSTAEDTADFCIAREVPTKDTPQVFDTPPVKETPSTGPEMLSLLALIPAAASGMYLRKKSIK